MLEPGGERAVVRYVQPPASNARLVVDAPRSVLVYREELDDPDRRA